MAKRKKMKHYSHSYYRPRPRPLRVAVTVLLIAAVFAVGWLAGPSVLDFGASTWYSLFPSGRPAPSSSEPTQAPVDSEGGAPADSQDEQQPVEAPPESEPASQPQGTVAVTSGLWQYLPAGSITNESAPQLAAQLAESGVQYAVITLKDETGAVYCVSANETAAAVSQNMFDLAAVASAFEAAGVTPVARICAFRDEQAASRDRTMSIHYGQWDTVVNWLDNAPEAGGKPWLNPYTDNAVGYISALMQEASAAGFRDVLLACVQFPAQEDAVMSYGPTNGSRSERLAQLVADWQEAYGSALWFEYPASSCQAERPSSTLGGALPAGLGVRQLVVTEAESTEALNALCAAMREAGCEAVVGVEGVNGSTR